MHFIVFGDVLCADRNHPLGNPTVDARNLGVHLLYGSVENLVGRDVGALGTLDVALGDLFLERGEIFGIFRLLLRGLYVNLFERLVGVDIRFKTINLFLISCLLSFCKLFFGIKDFVLFSPDDCTLVCLFGSISLDKVLAIASE